MNSTEQVLANILIMTSNKYNSALAAFLAVHVDYTAGNLHKIS